MKLSPLLPVAVALLLGASAPAWAESEEVRKEAAKALVEQGSNLYSNHDYAGALSKFQAAYELLPNPKLFYNIGQAAMQADNALLAANSFAAFLSQTLPSADLAKARTTAEHNLEMLSQNLAELRVNLDPPDAVLQVDGHPAQATGTYVFPGRHLVSASAEGFATKEEELSLHSAEHQTLPLRLTPVAAPAPAPPPPLVVQAEPPPPTPPPTTPPVPPAAGPLLEPAESTSVAAPVTAIPALESERDRTGVVICGIGTGAALVASGLFGVLAGSENSALHESVLGAADGQGSSAVPGLRSEVSRDATISTVALGVAVVAAGVGVYLYFSHPSGSPPAVTPDGAAHF